MTITLRRRTDNASGAEAFQADDGADLEPVDDRHAPFAAATGTGGTIREP
ncbi:hypothetical protein ACFY8C_19890 [Streptomyces flavochromogenes]|jgi:hypothetical protein|uniref:Uncharacterized protein n=1 Tax=Streptomyces flavochromogenes TaxID=68199 RepID=A0ABW6XSU5_9ACTN|nr:hypothetical protein [Streptomyces flavochromogenes]